MTCAARFFVTSPQAFFLPVVIPVSKKLRHLAHLSFWETFPRRVLMPRVSAKLQMRPTKRLTAVVSGFQRSGTD